MNDNHRMTGSIDRIAEELAGWAGSGALIIDHMARWPGRESGGADATEILRTLLRDTLSPIAERHAAKDLSIAADVLADALETLAGEILLVDPSVLEEEA